MDKFTKYVLLIMVAAVALMIISTYIGVFIYGGNMETKYVTIIESEAEKLGLNFSHLVELGEVGEYTAFSAAGAVAGFLIGYLIPPIFEAKKAAKQSGGEANA
jgi:hypothetical protein